MAHCRDGGFQTTLFQQAKSRETDSARPGSSHVLSICAHCRKDITDGWTVPVRQFRM